MFRRYSPAQGRWISPDPLGVGAVNPGNPQTWNRYAYVGNNPLSHTDALGLDEDFCDPDSEDCGGGGGGSDPGGSDPGPDPGSTPAPPPGPVSIPGFCDASCGGSGFGGGVDANGIPNNFGPGYLMQATSPMAQLGAGVSRYLSIITTGWDPVLGINWNNPPNYLEQANGQYNRLSGNLANVFGPGVTADPTNCDLIGGHCNFLLSCDSSQIVCPSAGRYDDGVHIENMNGALWVHDDTVSPWIGPFSAGALVTGNFWEHGFVDLIGGTFLVGAFSQ